MAKFTLICLMLVFAVPAHAYVGPGAGFALVGSFVTILVAFFTAVFAIFTYPIRWTWRMLRRKAPARAWQTSERPR